MIYIAWVISLVAVFLLGYHFRGLTKKIEHLETQVKKKVSKPKEEPESELIDLTDPVAEARYQQKKLMEDLNKDEPKSGN